MNVAQGNDILIVDDDAGQRSLLTSFLTGQGFDRAVAVNGRDALAALSDANYAMMISDVRMPEMDGLEALHLIRERHPRMPVLMVTAFPDIKDAVAAMQDGAVNYLQKPIDLDELLSSVRSSLGQLESLRDVIGGLPIPRGVIAESAMMRQIMRDASLVAQSESRILLTGESGVGKEVMANLIQGWSDRRDGPFVKVNCAAIPEHLLESEFFAPSENSTANARPNGKISSFRSRSGGTLISITFKR